MATKKKAAADHRDLPRVYAVVTDLIGDAPAKASPEESDTLKRRAYRARLLRRSGDKTCQQSKQRALALSRFWCSETLRVKLCRAGVLQLSWSETDFLQVKLSKDDTLWLSETDILQVSSNDAFVLHQKLSETDILQLQCVNSGTAPQRLSETDILQLQETDDMQQGLTETDILQLREGETLLVKLSKFAGESANDSEGRLCRVVGSA